MVLNNYVWSVGAEFVEEQFHGEADVSVGLLEQLEDQFLVVEAHFLNLLQFLRVLLPRRPSVLLLLLLLLRRHPESTHTSHTSHSAHATHATHASAALEEERIHKGVPSKLIGIGLLPWLLLLGRVLLGGGSLAGHLEGLCAAEAAHTSSLHCLHALLDDFGRHHHAQHVWVL